MMSLVFGMILTSFCLLSCNEPSTPGTTPNTPPGPRDTTYAIQGEYLGVDAATGDSMGGQVAAEGQDTFSLLLLSGGLPGRGWNGQNQELFSGTLEGDSVRFSQNGFSLSVGVAGDSLLGMNGQGQRLRLAKIYRQSPTLGEAPPAGAVVLFNGSSVAAWTSAFLDSTSDSTSGSTSKAITVLRVDTTTSGASTVQSFGDFTLHVEFYLPFEPPNSGQDRANSGVFLQDRYELQILDSFGQSLADLAAVDPSEPAQECGAIYGQTAPLTNMSLPPLTWQTYDVTFTAAQWDFSGNKTQNASVTVRQNGIIIQQNLSIPGSTLEGNLETPAPGPIFLQYHGHSVLFRNIWIVPQP